ncbi:uncharacterized protein LOC106668591 [Cimex lectularius]|uniref:Glutaredoxin domain-containing protein n=1 Tax=Cimex lectularius TaxID=79782 RepID=A0A8I6RWK0_CIMLE|nr:uncharacterized protein LOC106668591 [Cimex lectularius]
MSISNRIMSIMGCCFRRDDSDSEDEYDLERMLAENKVLVISRLTCPLSWEAKDILSGSGINFASLELDLIPEEEEELVRQLRAMVCSRILPLIFVKGKFIGGTEELRRLRATGELWHMMGVKVPTCYKRFKLCKDLKTGGC